jgi:hypothetical protein
MKRKYLQVGLYTLKRELARETCNEELVFYLCQLIVSIKGMIRLFTEFLEKGDDEAITINSTEAAIVKTHLKIFKDIKRDISFMFNKSVELH